MDQTYLKRKKKKINQASFPGHFNNGNRAFFIKDKKKNPEHRFIFFS